MYLKDIDSIVQYCRNRSHVNSVKTWESTNGRTHLTIKASTIPTQINSLVNHNDANIEEITSPCEITMEIELNDNY